MKYISIIACITKNNVIGKGNIIPWHMPSDLLWFKLITTNKPVIMGRITWESINCSPLKNRTNIVITRNKFKHSKKKKFLWASSIKEAIELAGNVKEVMIIGGSKIYQSAFIHVNKMYLTYINKIVEYSPHNKFFPKYNESEWKKIYYKYNKSDEKNKYNYIFKIFKKI